MTGFDDYLHATQVADGIATSNQTEPEDRDERPEDDRADDEAGERDGWNDEDGTWRRDTGGEG